MFLLRRAKVMSWCKNKDRERGKRYDDERTIVIRGDTHNRHHHHHHLCFWSRGYCLIYILWKKMGEKKMFSTFFFLWWRSIMTIKISRWCIMHTKNLPLGYLYMMTIFGVLLSKFPRNNNLFKSLWFAENAWLSLVYHQYEHCFAIFHTMSTLKQK